MRAPLLLVAASGFAREALEAVRAGDAYEVVGFVDDDPALWGEVVNDVKVLGGLDAVDDVPDAALLICAGKGSARASLAARLGVPESRYATVVDPGVFVPPSCVIGPGTIVLRGAVLTADVSIGRHVVVMPNAVLTHDDVLGAFSTLCAGVVLGGAVHVGAGAYIGMNASVRQHLTIGSDAVVGMGSVVLNHVPDRQVWYGAPARARSGPTAGAGTDF